MFKILKDLFKTNKQRVFCYCPKCKNELISSNSFVSDEELVTYECTNCNTISQWLFDTPVPILINEFIAN